MEVESCVRELAAKFLLPTSECFQAREIVAFGIITCELFAPKKPMCMYSYKREMRKWYFWPLEEGIRARSKEFLGIFISLSLQELASKGGEKNKLRWFISKLEARKGKHPHPYSYIFPVIHMYLYIYIILYQKLCVISFCG